MAPVKRNFSPPVESLVSNGRFNFGTYNQPIKVINPLEARSPLGRWLPRRINNLRLKEWQACEMGNARFFMLAVIYNAKFMALVQFFVIDKQRQQKWLFEKKLLPCRAKVATGLFGTQSSYQYEDFSITFANSVDKKEIILRLYVRQKGNIQVQGEFRAELITEPLVICHPFGPNQGLYSHKGLQPMHGWMLLDGERFQFSAADSFFVLDDHKGFYPYVMEYDWLCGAGHDSELGLIGFNLTSNQVLHPAVYNENCLWKDGRTHLLPPVVFSRPQGVYGSWQVTDESGCVELTFFPEYKGEVKLNLGIAESEYYGPCGRIKGQIRTLDGDQVEFSDLFGMGEQKMIRL